MVTYETPKVYYERLDAMSSEIAAVRTDIAGFIGIAPRGPVNMAVPVESFRQYQTYFGGFTGTGFLAYTVRGFFENGGRRCWIVRVASSDAGGTYANASTVFTTPSPVRNVWRIGASSPGVWGNNLSVRLVATHNAQTLNVAAKSRPGITHVRSVAGFGRFSLVRISQPGMTPALRVIADVDPIDNLLIYEAPLIGFDPDRPLLIESVAYTLLVQQSGTPIFLVEGLSLVPQHPRYGPSVLPPLRAIKPAKPVVDFALAGPDRVGADVPAPVVIEEMRTGANLEDPVILDVGRGTVRLSGGADGLSLLAPGDFLGEPVDPTDTDDVAVLKRRGLRCLEQIDEIAMIAVPDINVQPIAIPPHEPLPPCIPDICLPTEIPPAEPFREDTSFELPPVFSDDQIFLVQAAMVRLCEDRQDLIAILDPPFSAAQNDAIGPAAIRNWRMRFDSKYAALYYPWLRISDPLRARDGLTRDIPPSGHVAGQYARTDLSIGVHKAPANAPIAWTQDVTVSVSDPLHGLLNTLGINVAKVVASRGTRIMGARTVSSDPDWVFVNVRRLLMMIRKSIYLATQWAVFEPNEWVTRAKLQLSISSFLMALWQHGALVGAVAREAFYVKCDEDNNPPRERENGRLLAEIGVAPSRPFEFVVIRVGRRENQFEIQESQVLGAR